MVAANTNYLPLTDSNGTESLPPYTVVFGEFADKRIWDGTNESMERILYKQHIHYLREVIPK